MLNSERLYLCAVEPSDADFMFEVENDASAWRYGDTVAPLSRKILRDYALGYDANPFSAGQLRLIIKKRNDGAPVGIADLYELSHRHMRAFAGIYILPALRKNGYAEEALRLLGEYAFSSLHLHTLGAKIEEGNSPAVALFEKTGYTRAGRLEDWLSAPGGKFSDMLVYTRCLG